MNRRVFLTKILIKNFLVGFFLFLALWFVFFIIRGCLIVGGEFVTELFFMQYMSVNTWLYAIKVSLALSFIINLIANTGMFFKIKSEIKEVEEIERQDKVTKSALTKSEKLDRAIRGSNQRDD